jgi:hypothetical protein
MDRPWLHFDNSLCGVSFDLQNEVFMGETIGRIIT